MRPGTVLTITRALELGRSGAYTAHVVRVGVVVEVVGMWVEVEWVHGRTGLSMMRVEEAARWVGHPERGERCDT